jgi:restriction system protein
MYFERLGFVVEQTPTVGDGGVDLVLRRGEELVLVQCKRHARPVGEPVLRDLYGALVHFGANSGVVCSSSGFTPAACKWAHEKAIRLVDGDEILKALA